jgi:uncharacterized membrane protein
MKTGNLFSSSGLRLSKAALFLISNSTAQYISLQRSKKRMLGFVVSVWVIVLIAFVVLSAALRGTTASTKPSGSHIKNASNASLALTDS